MRIDSLYQSFNSIYNTHQAGFYRPVSDFIPAVTAVSMEIFHQLGKQETKTQIGEDVLAPFSKTANLVVTDLSNSKVAIKPGDYQYYKGAGLIMEESRICGEPDCEVLKNGD